MFLSYPVTYSVFINSKVDRDSMFSITFKHPYVNMRKSLAQGNEEWMHTWV